MKKFVPGIIILLLSLKYVDAQQQASFTMDVDSGCPPFTVQFTNTTPGGASNFYQWDFGDGETSTDFSPAHTYLNPGSYLVTLYGYSFNGMQFLPGMDSVNAGGITISEIPAICLVTVDSTSTKNVIVWEKTAQAGIAAVNIYREENANWLLVGVVPQSELSLFVDSSTSIDPDIESYSYRISYADICGNESGLSAFHQTMHLSAYTIPPSGDVNLIWVTYAGFGFDSYRILRDTIGLDQFEVIDSVLPGMSSYIDSAAPAGSRYIVEVMHPVGCTASKMAQNHNSSRSNKTSSAPLSSVSEKVLVRFDVSPNPGNGRLRITADANMVNGEIEIYNTKGQLIHNAFAEGNYTDIDFDRGKGLYFLRYKTSTNVFYRKIVVE